MIGKTISLFEKSNQWSVVSWECHLFCPTISRWLTRAWARTAKRWRGWKKLLLGLLTLARLNPPAFLLAQNRPVKFERLGLEQAFGQNK